MPNKTGITAVAPCRQCDAMISVIAEVCPACGVRQHPDAVGRPLATSEKKLVPAAILCFALGVFGAHRFYVGKTGTGLLMLFTLGGLGLWMLYDLILLLTGQFRDADERLVTEAL